MGYLDNSSITVDAVLTKKGREILKNGENLNITSFTMSDTGVDYTLWNPNHSDGSAKYGEAIENLPQLEASVHAGTLLTLKEGNTKAKIIVDLVGYTSTLSTGGPADYYYVIQDPSIVSGGSGGKAISGTGAEMFVQEQDIPHARMYQFNGDGFHVSAIQQDTAGKETHIYVVHYETGAYNSFRVINNLTKNQRAILASKIIN